MLEGVSPDASSTLLRARERFAAMLERRARYRELADQEAQRSLQFDHGARDRKERNESLLRQASAWSALGQPRYALDRLDLINTLQQDFAWLRERDDLLDARRARQWCRHGEFERALPTYRRLILRSKSARSSADTRASYRADLAELRLQSGRLVAARNECELARSRSFEPALAAHEFDWPAGDPVETVSAEPPRDASVKARLDLLQARAEVELGELAAARRCLDRHRASSRDPGPGSWQEWLQVEGLKHRCDGHCSRDAGCRLREQRALARLDDLDELEVDEAARGIAEGLEGWLLCQDLPHLATFFRRAIALEQRRNGHSGTLAHLEAALGAMEARSGHLPEARRRLEAGVEALQSSAIDSPVVAYRFRAELARVLAALGEPEAAHRELSQPAPGGAPGASVNLR